MNSVRTGAKVLGLTLVVVVGSGMLVLLLLSLPGMRRLPRQRRVTLDGITTIEDAVKACRRTGLTGWELVAYAQQLAARKFTYSRRNPWDTPSRAFERGMGYCQQQTLALKRIYDRLGVQAQPVYAFRCRFPPTVIHGIAEAGRMSPHTWLRVRIDGEERDVCCGRPTNRPGVVHFAVLSEVKPLVRWLRPFSHLSSMIENIRRDRAALRTVQASEGA
jgi:hypothetical protein